MRKALALLASILLCTLLLGAQAKPADNPSTSSQKAPAPPAKKARKVLTDDDFDSTRDPKAIRDAAAAEAAKAAEKAKSEAPAAPPPDEVDEELKFLREQIKTTESLAENVARTLTRYQANLFTTTDAVKLETIRESIRLMEELQVEHRTKITDLQAKIRALEKQKKGAQAPPPQEEKKEKEEEKKP